MSSTCPYILAKTTQLLAAARITSQNESFKEGLSSNKIIQKFSKLTTDLKTLKVETIGFFIPPRLRLEELTMVASSICVHIRDQKLLSLHTEGNEYKTFYKVDENSDNHKLGVVNEQLCRQNKGALQEKTEQYFAKYGIAEDELHR